MDLGTVDATELGRATRRAVARALAEDLGDRGDVTSLATVPAGRRGRGTIVARADGVLFGVEVVLHVFEQVDNRVEVELHVADGDRVHAGQVLATLTGPLSSILTGERVALNFLGHLSGVASQVRRFADAAGDGVAVRDTRKTTPGLRLLEKAAVRAGGGHNHRIGLYDALLVKDNHIVAAGSVTAAVEAALARCDGRHVQVEVTDLTGLDDALAAGATDILLDNLSPDEVREAVERTAGRASLEASGSIDLGSVGDYAQTGVDRIAIGRLTHSTAWLDVALDLAELPDAQTSTPAVPSDDAPGADGRDDVTGEAAQHEQGAEAAGSPDSAESAESAESPESPEGDDDPVDDELRAALEDAVRYAGAGPQDDAGPTDSDGEAPVGDSLFAWRDRSDDDAGPGPD